MLTLPAALEQSVSDRVFADLLLAFDPEGWNWARARMPRSAHTLALQAQTDSERRGQEERTQTARVIPRRRNRAAWQLWLLHWNPKMYTNT